MKLTIEQTALASGLSKMQKVVQSKTTIPILKNIKIAATVGELVLTGTNLDMEVTVHVAADVSIEGVSTVPFALLSESVAKYPKSGLVKMELDGHDLKIACNRSRGKLAVLPAGDFPHMSDDDYQGAVTFESDVLQDMFTKVAFAASTEETRYYLNGVYFTQEDGFATGAATDGHRLAKYKTDVIASDLPSVIIPSGTIAALSLPDSGDVLVEVSENKIQFSTATWSLKSKVIDGVYPDYTRIIPQGQSSTASFDGKDFRDAIGRVVIKDNHDSRVKLDFNQDEIALYTHLKGIAEKTDAIDSSLNGEPLSIGFNHKYLVQSVQVLDGNCIVDLFGEGRPAVIRDDASEGWLVVIMPMRGE